MRFEPRRVFATGRPVRPLACGLPAAIAFLEVFGVPRATLVAAVARGEAEGVDARRALLAGGAVSETRYHVCLARHLGVPFVDTWPSLRPPLDVRAALLSSRVALADGACARWLLAPTTRDVEVLLAARDLGLALPSIAIATPSHLAALLRHRAQASIAYAASHALPDAAPRLSARDAFDARAAVAFAAPLVLALVVGLVLGLRWPTAALGLLFLAGLVFRLMLCAEGLAGEAETPPLALGDAALPFYSVLVPLHQEANMVAPLVAALDQLDYPRSKLEVLFLVEADDLDTRTALARRLPAGFKVIEVPPGAPRTKPRALNAGLLLAHGDLVTVYDAEDRPDPDQLRRAAARFAQAGPRVACLQARLSIHAGDGGLLEQLFAIEYALLFDVFNLGLARRGLPIALGGTSNHFRADALRAAGGWDAWNVTEDADLGLRLARLGYAIDMLNSTTFEEAPRRLRAWINQRRRWTKGWMQTLVVLGRDLPAVCRQLGTRRARAVALMLTNLVIGPLLTPPFLVLVLWDLATRGLPTPQGILELGQATLACSVLALGMAGTFWGGLVGARKRGLLAPRLLLAFLPYQLMIGLAAWGGLVDLVRNPFHWRKTPHGAAPVTEPDRPSLIAKPWPARLAWRIRYGYRLILSTLCFSSCFSCRAAPVARIVAASVGTWSKSCRRPATRGRLAVTDRRRVAPVAPLYADGRAGRVIGR